MRKLKRKIIITVGSCNFWAGGIDGEDSEEREECGERIEKFFRMLTK